MNNKNAIQEQKKKKVPRLPSFKGIRFPLFLVPFLDYKTLYTLGSQSTPVIYEVFLLLFERGRNVLYARKICTCSMSNVLRTIITYD